MGDKVQQVIRLLEEKKSEAGFEFHPFKVKWYNSCVQPAFHLPYREDALCVLVVSIPSMFERTLKPFILAHYSGVEEPRDPLDQCMRHEFREMQELLHDHQSEFILDYEIHHASKRPKILVQTAGHVAGAAFYYRKEMVSNPPWEPDAKIYGVSMHPRYGGWFAFRGIIVFSDLLIGEGEGQVGGADFRQKEPEQCVGSQARIIELLQRFNGNWQDWSYRDTMDNLVVERYSEEQKKFFATLPKDRLALFY